MVVFVAAPGRPLGQVIHDQLSRLLELQRATAGQRDFLLAADRRIRAAIPASGKTPPDVPPGLAALYPPYPGPFLKAELALNPVALAARCKPPMLVIDGEADTEASAARDAVRFAQALAARKDLSEVFTPAGVSHNLKTVASDDDPGIAGDLAPSVKDKLTRWANAVL